VDLEAMDGLFVVFRPLEELSLEELSEDELSGKAGFLLIVVLLDDLAFTADFLPIFMLFTAVVFFPAGVFLAETAVFSVVFLAGRTDLLLACSEDEESVAGRVVLLASTGLKIQRLVSTGPLFLRLATRFTRFFCRTADSSEEEEEEYSDEEDSSDEEEGSSDEEEDVSDEEDSAEDEEDFLDEEDAFTLEVFFLDRRFHRNPKTPD
jgi:hypothetical protein